MATAIEWTEEAWNPIVGCSKISPGCDNCYAERMAKRLRGMGIRKYQTVVDSDGWTGQAAMEISELIKPWDWDKPRMIFVSSMGDLFHWRVFRDWVDAVYAMMAICSRHTFHILTKRPIDMHNYLQTVTRRRLEQACWRHDLPRIVDSTLTDWPLPKVWLGVTAENQQAADGRIPILMDTPAAVRFVSCEPLLGPVDLPDQNLDWVIAGGESGPAARPAHPDWLRHLRDQCREAGIPFFFKQWGEWAPACASDGIVMKRVGKKAAGRLLDGIEHNEYPAKTGDSPASH